jgi:hypothetical protein
VSVRVVAVCFSFAADSLWLRRNRPLAERLKLRILSRTVVSLPADPQKLEREVNLTFQLRAMLRLLARYCLAERDEILVDQQSRIAAFERELKVFAVSDRSCLVPVSSSVDVVVDEDRRVFSALHRVGLLWLPKTLTLVVPREGTVDFPAVCRTVCESIGPAEFRMYLKTARLNLIPLSLLNEVRVGCLWLVWLVFSLSFCICSGGGSSAQGASRNQLRRQSQFH